MYNQYSKGRSQHYFICVVFVLSNFVGQSRNELRIFANSSSLIESTLLNIPTKPSANALLTYIPEVNLIAPAYVIDGISPSFFANFSNLLTTLLFSILLVLTLSLYRKNWLKSKANILLKDENEKLKQEKENAELEAIGNAQCLSTICHELRTPLNSTTGIVQLLLDTELTPVQLEYLSALQFSSDYLISLANNVLVLNKLEVTKPEIRYEPFNLEKTLENILNLLYNSALANNTKMYLQFDPRIPKEILGDNTKISQILINLISNAVHFTDNGKIWVRTLVKDITDNSAEILFEIEDNGIGIPKEDHQLVFDSFSQGLLYKNRREGGTGLGLAIVKVLLEVLGSEIHMESEVGKGSKFWFILKCNYLAVAPLKVKYEINEKQSAFLANKSVLLVEDDLISQMITKKLLERKQMNCIISDNGEEAIELIKKKSFNLVLMDLSLRGINGLKAVKEIRKFNNDIPIIALTAVQIDKNWQELKDAGFTGVIPKPFKIENLFEKILHTMH